MRHGLPQALDAERLVLGSVLLDHSHWDDVSGRLDRDDFVLESHRFILEAMKTISDRKQKIDRITVATELQRAKKYEAVGGLTYLISLDENMPRLPNLDSYILLLREKTTLRRAIDYGKRIMNLALMGESSAADILASAELGLAEMATEENEEHGLRSLKQIMEGCDGGINSFLSPHLRIRGLHFGMPKLQRRIFGLDPGKLIIIAARTSEGKSALALQWAIHIVKTQGPVLFFSLEMSSEDQALRLIARDSGVSFHRFRYGQLDQQERIDIATAAGRAAEYPLYFSDEAYPTMKSVYMASQTAVKKHGAVAIFLDQLQLLSYFKSGYPGIDFRSENEALSFIAPSLKNMAKRLKVPVVALSHLTKEAGKNNKGGDPRPTLNMIHGSSAIAKSADVVIFPYREILDRPQCPELKQLAEFIIRKNRSGPLGTIMGRFNGKTLTFSEDEDQDGDDE